MHNRFLDRYINTTKLFCGTSSLSTLLKQLTQKDEAIAAFKTVIQPKKDKVNSDKRRSEFVSKVLSEDTVVFAVKYNSKYIGTASVTFKKHITDINSYLKHRCGYTIPERLDVRDEAIGFLSNLYVKEEFQGKGIGRRLFEHRMDHCIGKCGCLLSELWVHPGRDAVHLYESYGFYCLHDCDTHWESAVNTDVECSICGYDCECSGEIWYADMSSITLQ